MAHLSGSHNQDIRSRSDRTISGVFVGSRCKRDHCHRRGALNVRPVKVDGVSLYRLSTKPGFDAETTLRDLRTRFDTERLAALVISAEKYLSLGQRPDSLSV